MIEPPPVGAYETLVPGLPPREMTPAERRRLQRATERVERAEEALAEARAEWAAVVRMVGLSTAARELGITRQAMAGRLRTIESRKGRP